METSRPTRGRFALATLRATLAYFLAYSGIFIAWGVIAVDRAIRLGPMERFRLGDVEVPKLMGGHASNLVVAIFCGVAIATIAVGLAIRYAHSRTFLAKARSKGVTDLNGDGKVDVYTDRFLDDL